MASGNHRHGASAGDGGRSACIPAWRERVDAAVPLRSLGVVDGHNSGKGRLLMLIRLANGRTVALDAKPPHWRPRGTCKIRSGSIRD